jgi:hypothetical protein
MNSDEQSLYAEMRAAIQGDRERAEQRAQKQRTDPPPAPPPPAPLPETPEPRRFAAVRRLLGGRPPDRP